ncbi:MAG: fibronectin type III domain-containing protein [candidate division WOR-3 bacterium]|nr:MAG: fibronectin type III domain-containing protein [candidate division WOR-3 bacterium]
MTVLLCILLAVVEPPETPLAYDYPNDNGGQIVITWQPSPQDNEIDSYDIYRSQAGGPFEKINSVTSGTTSFIDTNVRDGDTYRYRIAAVKNSNVVAQSEISEEVVSSQQWFHTGRFNIFLGIFAYSTILLWFIYRARTGKKLFIRKIPGLEALDEAVGRATEMGKPILYVPGLSTIDDIATIASLNILSRVAQKTAEYNTTLLVPNRNPVVYTVSQEVVKEAYTNAGRPDAYNPDNVYFITAQQFAYVAAVCGTMVREKPATNLFLGYFWAESLILAETGASTGAIQIAGTDSVFQLPFFITACDYTLIGEELYAASAYLSREPLLLGSLKGQDWGKMIILGILIVASALILIGFQQIFSLFNI